MTHRAHYLVEDVHMRTRLMTVVAAILALAPAFAAAQSAPASPSIAFTGGYAGFLDDAFIGHTVAGVGAEWLVGSRLAVGPEMLYMVGPGSDRDLFLLGVARIGVRRFTTAVAPYVVAGGGLMRHSNRFVGQSFSATEGAFVLGGGVRVRASDRVFIAPEFTLGWEAHVRMSVSVGIRLP